MYFYAQKWSRAYKEPSRQLDETRARALHDSGAWYTVLAGDLQRPSAFIEVVGENNYVGVNFLDEHLRYNLVYDFQRDGSGRLFMSGGDVRVFEGETDQLTFVEQYRFKATGLLTVTKHDLAAKTAVSGSRQVDVGPNYESWPVFGRYESLLVRERDVMRS